MNHNILYKETGGARIPFGGLSLRASWPFARLEVYSDLLILKINALFVSKNINFNKKEIIIERVYWFPFLAEGVRIKLRQVNYYFLSLYSKKLIGELEKYGYKIN
jgi:hypothetical protein